MRNENRNEDAVSPVIGVMLMLVVTVVIAAVVVMFSTGLAGDTKTTPTALFEVSYTGTWKSEYGNDELTTLGLRHKGGDAIPLEDLQITLEPHGSIGPAEGILQILTATDSKMNMNMEEGKASVDSNDLIKYNAMVEEIEYYRWLLNADDDELNEDDIDNKDCFLDAYVNPDGSIADEYYEENSQAREWFKNGGPTPRVTGGESAYPLSVLGQATPTESVVSTGDIIHVTVTKTQGDKPDINSRIVGGTVKWTISYIPTNSVIAKGEFEVIAD